jgi:hypothetical protein
MNIMLLYKTVVGKLATVSKINCQKFQCVGKSKSQIISSSGSNNSALCATLSPQGDFSINQSGGIIGAESSAAQLQRLPEIM